MTSHLDTFEADRPFPLDPFQRAACAAIEADRGVLVCAPTGAGKTIVGEFAVSLALSRGTKCFYTTPIKALSNQKFHDLCALHGEEAVGLLTGDVSINHDADIVVMTTEVLRNMIYAESTTLDRLTHVVFDEIHYLADKSRGAVWEEAILGLPGYVKVIGLSATVSNAEEFGQWLGTVRGDTEIIVTEHRPVPLEQWMLVGRQVIPLLEGDNLSPVLATAVDRALEKMGEDSFRSRSGAPRHQDRFRPLGRPEVLEILQGLNMLPAITFIFSRAGCDSALYQCSRSKLVLTTQQEADEIARIIDAGVAQIPDDDLKVLGFRHWRSVLMRGFAAHHAGMLPAFRHIVEELFVKGLLRAVFATETLALGINMPARTVVMEKLVKFDGEGHVDLTPGQYTQLTGRAGRRGIDTIGNAVVQWTPATDPEFVASLASTRTYPLNSTFAPGYNMSVNLLKTIGFEQAHQLIEKSFAQFQADGSVVSLVQQINSAQAKAAAAEELLAQALTASGGEQALGADPAATLVDYMQLRRKLTAAEKAAKKHALAEREKEVTRVLGKLQLGEVIALPGKKQPVVAVVTSPARDRHDPRPEIVLESGWCGRIGAGDVPMPPMVIGHMPLPRHVVAAPRRHSREITRIFARNHYNRPKKMRSSARVRPTKEITALKEALRAHPAHRWARTEEYARLGEEIARQRATAQRLQGQVSSRTDTLGKTFDRILALLGELDYVEFGDAGPTITEEGERLSHIHNDCDLLVSQCLRRGIWSGLDPAELAGVVSMCTFENRKEARGEPTGATDPMVDAMNATIRVWEELSFDEKRHNLTVTRYPDAGFALAIHQWCAGAPLEYCLAAAAESGAELTPGDFVRQARQVIDLLEQVRRSAYDKDTATAARQAAEAIRRGVVAIGT